jgi:hypothetical protein
MRTMSENYNCLTYSIYSKHLGIDKRATSFAHIMLIHLGDIYESTIDDEITCLSDIDDCGM